MKQVSLILMLVLTVNCNSVAQKNKKDNNRKQMSDNKEKIVKSETEWKRLLTPQQYYVLRQKGTDRPGEGGYTKLFDKGTYKCAACDTQLFKSNSKYESHCGWPSFDDALPGAVVFTKDNSLGMIRTEITCARCGGHLGHVFDDGPKETTGQRYCVNTSSITFVTSK
jgi:peptide-methionine (R)-S-oxide reductase